MGDERRGLGWWRWRWVEVVVVVVFVVEGGVVLATRARIRRRGGSVGRGAGWGRAGGVMDGIYSAREELRT